MDRKKIFNNHKLLPLFEDLNQIHKLLDDEFKTQFDRSLPISEALLDRWVRAEKLGFGESSSIYDTSFVFGNPEIGDDVWIGPYTIIDASGGLNIGNNVTISAGVHIYTHDNIKQTLLGKNTEIELESVSIGNNSYIGPNSIITKGNTIGNHCVIGTNSFVKKSFSDNSIIAGNPAKKIGEVVIENGKVEFKYSDTI
jgi:acetyltransferase-like isoleucine patch superfamily enzyme